MNRRIQPALVLALLAAGIPCAHAKDASPERNADKARKLYLEGARALENKNYTTAEADFKQATQLDPLNQQYQASYTIVLGHQVTLLIQDADKASLLGHPAQAHADLLLAYRLDPNNPMIAQHIDQIAASSEDNPVDLYPEDKSIAPPVQLNPSRALHSFNLHAGAQNVLRQVLESYGIQPSIDSSVKDQVIRFNTAKVTFDQASRMLKLATGTIFVPLDPSRVLVADDTEQNRAKFQRLAEETVYLPGLDPADVNDLGLIAHNVFNAEKATVSANRNTLTIRAPQSELAAFNGTLSEMLDGKSEVQVDVRLYDIAKTRSLNVGVQLPQQTTVFNIPSELNSVISQNSSLVQQIISSGLASPGDIGAIALALLASGQLSGSSILSQPFAYFGGGQTLTGIVPGTVTGNLALNSSDSRIIDHITMRLLNQQESTIKAGERYPIVTSSYSNFGASTLNVPGLTSAGISSTLASLGLSTSALQSGLGQTIPQVQYQDLGLTLIMKPYIQKGRDVTLNLDLKITSLQGTSLNDIPVLNNQEFSTITTLKQGSSALLVSSLSKQQSRAVTGVPGLTDLPGFQSTTNNQTEYDFSDLVILITPHIIRLAHKQEAGKMFILPVH
jgi:general secretion pathway protein D